jgi:type VI secretion system protein ImpJ
MEMLSPLVWSEGMHLAQHHFQAQSKYFENTIGFVFQRLMPTAYGLLGCEFDADALRNGLLSLVHARGVMPDGLVFNFPESDRLPDARDIRELFRPTEQSSRVLLTIPPWRPTGANTAMSASETGVRYFGEERQVDDETGAEGSKAVRIGRKNFRLLLESESRGDDVVLPVARIRRDGSGHFVFDPRFIPPSLQIGATRGLMEMLTRLADTLAAQGDALARGQRVGSSEAPDRAQQVARLWLRHTIHSSLGPLRHHLALRRSSPEQVYADLAQLAGALCTFTLDASPSGIPKYDHENLEETFTELDAWIRRSLDVVSPTQFVGVPLVRVRRFLFTGAIADPRALHPVRWILEASLESSGAPLPAELTRLIKVCSGASIGQLVREGTPGLALTHISLPPAEIPVRADCHYYAVGLEGPCWESIVQTSEIGVYTPDAAGVKELTLLAVLR